MQFDGSMGRFRISPDGEWLAFAGLEPSPDEEQARKEKRDWRVLGENPRNHTLWVSAATPEGGKRPPRRIVNGPYDVVNFDWSPDSRLIAFEHQPEPNEDSWIRADVSEVEVSTGAVRVLASSGAGEGEPRYSPDGRWLAYMRTPNPARWAGAEEIVLLPRQGGAPRVLPDTFDAGPSIPGLLPRKAMGDIVGWAGDSSRLLFTGAKGTRYVLYSVAVDGATRVEYAPAEGLVRGAVLNTRGTHVGFSGESPAVAPEGFMMSLAGGAPTRVTAANTDLPRLPLGETRRVRWKSTDGLEIEGLLTLPVKYQQGRRYPLVIMIHGGPMGWFLEEFTGRHGVYSMAGNFADRGWASLRPNIRGSGGYGRKFRFANYNDWGGKDYQDLMAGVDYLISSGIADPDRLAIMGWSYGGYMTSWAITRTKRFKAAVVGAGVTNLWSMTGTTDIVSFLPDYFSGEPWDNFKAYFDHSPMAHVKGVTTPTLILHGEADIRVPIGQSYELYNALKRQGVTTTMVVYPRMGHLPGEPRAELDVLRRTIEWVERHVGARDGR
jgi:dipeptidyl aminopeptidase/acylaminoacyl peptidase